MENRTNNQVEEILDYVKSIWNLNIAEEGVLDSLLYLIKGREFYKLKIVENLIDENYDDLIEHLPGYVISDIICDSGYIDRKDESELVSALEDLNYDFLDSVSEEELERAGYITEENKDWDLLTSMQMEEMEELFLKLDSMDREEILEGLRC